MGFEPMTSAMPVQCSNQLKFVMLPKCPFCKIFREVEKDICFAEKSKSFGMQQVLSKDLYREKY